MRTLTAGLLPSLFVLVVLAIAPISRAEVPAKINYQFRLADIATGAALVGQHSVAFAIYDTPSGGIPLWSESKTVEADSGGVVATILGSENAIGIPFDQPYWLEISVAGEVLQPRREIVSSPYALRSLNAEHADDATEAGNAGSLDGLTASAFADSGHVHDDRYYSKGDLSTPGSLNDPANPTDWTKLKNVPAGFADNADDTGTADGYSLDAADGDPVDAVYVDVAGDVGIGTTAPERKLHIKGAGPRILIEGETANPEVNFMNTGDTAGEVWAIYKHTPTGDLRFYQGGDRVTFEDATGYVGIGVDDPLEELHVRGTGPTYLYTEAPEGYASGVTLGVGGSPKWTMLYHPGDKELAFFRDGTGNMVTFTDSGRVGIGMEPTDGVLAVKAISPAIAVYGGCGVTAPISLGGGVGVRGYFTSDGVAGAGVIGEAYVASPVFSNANGVVGQTNADYGYGVLSIGGMGSTGPVTSIVETSDHGWRELYGLSSAENWFEDFGQARLEKGSATVNIDAVFADAADFAEPYHVFLTPLGDCGLYVAEKTEKSFTVKALGGEMVSIDFDYRIVGKRRGYETRRLRSADDTAAFIRQVSEPKAESTK